MWIGLLGPLVVTTDQGTRVAVAAGKQRSLLAALAVAAGDVVSADTLADAIWEGSRPATWEATLRNYVRRLRQVLGDGAGRWITTAPPRGYSLQAGTGELDLLDFTALRKRGLAAARSRAWERSSALLSEAETLWRGTPFADIPSRAIRDGHQPYLREALLTLTEARIDADLHLNRFTEVLPELRQLAAKHPERERFHSQLMLALYRCGRQGEALAAFHIARQYSVSELGVEPGPELTRLQHRILHADSGLRTGAVPG